MTHRIFQFVTLVIGLTMLCNKGQGQDYSYITNNGTITITDYAGTGGNVVIPSTINSLPVVSIDDGMFAYNSSLVSVTIPNSVTNIGAYTFFNCG